MEEYDITDIVYHGQVSVHTDEIALRMAAQGYANIVQDEEETRLLATQSQLDSFMSMDLDKFLED